MGWEVKSYTFLLVCHHWFEVASRTPELWSFWGTTLEEWKQYSRLSRAAPLDLALDGYISGGPLDIVLYGAIHDHATRNAIRRVHLRARDLKLLTSIVSSLMIDGEGFQTNSVESFVLLNYTDTPMDVSDFFDRYRFPNLRHLELISCITTGFDHLTSRTGALTTLALESAPSIPAPTLTTSELLSILVSNPSLRKVSLCVGAGPSYGDDGIHFQVPLHSLKELKLSGEVRDVVGILRRLDHPNKLDLFLHLYGCAVRDISRVIGPYLRDYVGHRGTPQHGLGLRVFDGGNEIGHKIGDVENLDPSTPAWDQMTWFAIIWILLNETPPKVLLEREILSLFLHSPQEKITYFQALGEPIALEAMSTRFQNIRALGFSGTSLPAISNIGGDREIFPALRHLFLDQVWVDNYDWSSLATSLARRASSGNQLDTLQISHSSHMCMEMAENIRSVVRHFQTEDPGTRSACPLGTCSRL